MNDDQKYEMEKTALAIAGGIVYLVWKKRRAAKQA